jgi:hypothetical protein
MGELIRFPGAQVDYDFLDSFEWTTELLEEYADRARELAGRSRFLADAPRWPRGVCQTCGSVPAGWRARRYRVGRYLLCSKHAESRLRLRVELAQFETREGMAS